MKINDTIKKLLERLVVENGNPYRFSKKLDGISQTTIRNWLIGKTNSISDENWGKLYPLLEDCLSRNEDIPINVDEHDDVVFGYHMLDPELNKSKYGGTSSLVFKVMELEEILDIREKSYLFEFLCEIEKRKKYDKNFTIDYDYFSELEK